MARFQDTANLLSVIQTCRFQQRSGMAFFTQALLASTGFIERPSLIPQIATLILTLCFVIIRVVAITSEGSKANILRLSNLILLIAPAYTSACLKGKSFKNQGHQKYITRLTEAKRQYRRHSDFRVGLYGQN